MTMYIRNIEVGRVPGFPKENIAATGEIQVTDKYYVAWSNRLNLAKELLGYHDGTSLIQPVSYALNPALRIYSTNVSIEPHGGITSSGEYIKAIVTATFGTLPYDIDSPRIFDGRRVYAIESLEPSSEFLTLNNDKITYSDNTELGNIEAPGVLIRQIDWIYTILQMPYIPASVITKIGRVNSNPVFSSIISAAAGCILVGTPQIETVNTSTGDRVFNITMRMTIRDYNWNLVPRTKRDSNGNITWDSLKEDGILFLPYKIIDISDIVI